MSIVRNGVNVDPLIGTINAIKDNPDLAHFHFRAANEWVSGGHSRTTIQRFYGAGSEATSRSGPLILEGDIDLHGFLGLSEQIRPGYQNIRVSYRVKSDAPREKLEELCEYVQKTSPVLDIISNPIPVSVTLAE